MIELDRRICDRARQSRDPRFDGRFFIAVTTTRIYCRPTCPARAPKDEHVRYFATAAAAHAAGFRPCLRCRPEAAPGTPAWAGTSSVVSRGLRLIADGALDDGNVDRLAASLGITARHLRRLFVRHLGATPIAVAITHRVHFAKKLLDETSLPCSEVAAAAGFGSVRRFNSEMRRIYARTPSQLRRLARRRTRAGDDWYQFVLAYRPPFDWAGLLGFLRSRATAGVEEVGDRHYARTIEIDRQTGAIAVSPAPGAHALILKVRFPDARKLLAIVRRVRAMFDLDADPAVITSHLRSDSLLARALRRHAGIRVPGAWDGFELTVRAFLGQQVSVAAATTVAGRVARLFGVQARELANAPLERAGVMPTRAETIRALARGVRDSTLMVGPALTSVAGIGDWTAQYVAMRALGDPDAFPSSDLVLRRAAGGLSARALEARAEAWRPWRAYAAMLLWRMSYEESRRPVADGSARRMGTGGAGRARPHAAGESRG